MPEDRIRIRRLRALGTHGVSPREQQRPQPFFLDITVHFDASPAVGSDRLEHTIDYVSVCRQAVAIVQEERYALLERLASRICDSLLERELVLEVSVTVAKPRVALDLDAEAVEVVLTRRRP